MFNILDRYIGRVVLWSVMLCDLTLIGLSALFKFVDQLRDVGEGSYTTSVALYYTLLNVPSDIVQFFPLAALLGGLIGLGSLATSSELVVMQASGRSKLSIVGAVLKTLIPMTIVILLIGEYVAPAANHHGDDVRIQARSGGTVSLSAYGVWAKDGPSFVNIGAIDREGQLHNIRLYDFNQQHRLKQIVDARTGSYSGDHWQLSGITDTKFGGDKIEVVTRKQQNWYSQLTPKKLSVVTINPSDMSIRALTSTISYRDMNKQDASQYKLEFWRKILSPLTIIAMMLLASSFVFGPLRTMAMGTRILIGIIAGFIFYVIDRIFGPMTLIYGMPPLAGAIIPAAIFLGLAFYLLMRRQ
ncbi:LPS export ABC transporter permease LptG [Dongshaea marina]|uniref:LPS export ABC transporter permease LptG n=1 Tax=Dongshaea marina TaxID=2047966 RepID=UPI000D3EDBDF|nr:LPS export ABC transporter permease LptG [Dongshaea marina]